MMIDKKKKRRDLKHKKIIFYACPFVKKKKQKQKRVMTKYSHAPHNNPTVRLRRVYCKVPGPVLDTLCYRNRKSDRPFSTLHTGRVYVVRKPDNNSNAVALTLLPRHVRPFMQTNKQVFSLSFFCTFSPFFPPTLDLSDLYLLPITLFHKK